MADFLPFLLVPVLIAVVVVLFMGLSVLARGGDPNRSNKLMRWRVGLQFLAVLLLILFFFLVKS